MPKPVIKKQSLQLHNIDELSIWINRQTNCKESYFICHILKRQPRTQSKGGETQPFCTENTSYEDKGDGVSLPYLQHGWSVATVNQYHRTKIGQKPKPSSQTIIRKG